MRSAGSAPHPDSRTRAAIAWILVFAALYATSRTHFLLFHAVAEVFCIVIAGGIFMITWHTRQISDSGVLFLFGLCYPFVALLDFFHLLAYEGMGSSPASGPTRLRSSGSRAASSRPGPCWPHRS